MYDFKNRPFVVWNFEWEHFEKGDIVDFGTTRG